MKFHAEQNDPNMYEYRIKFNPLDCLFRGWCEELGIEVFAPDSVSAIAAIERAVKNHINRENNSSKKAPLPDSLLELIINNYNYQVGYSKVAGVFVATCLELHAVEFGTTRQLALESVKVCAKEIISDLFYYGFTLPNPLEKDNFFSFSDE